MTRVEYQTKLVSAIWEMPDSVIEAAAERLRQARKDDDLVLIAGNGGSATTADHFAVDLQRNAGMGLRAISLCSNGGLITAAANDEGYENSFSTQVRALAVEEDVLVVISASGNSPSIIEALTAAYYAGVERIALVGFDGGEAATLAEHVIHIESNDYGVVEDAHLSVCHILTELLK